MGVENRMLITPTLRRRLRMEAEFDGGPGTLYGFAIPEDGRVEPFWAGYRHPPRPLPEQQMFAADMVIALNRALHHDGAWLVVLTHPETHVMGLPLIDSLAPVAFGRWVAIWIDRDGDPQFAMDNVDPFAECLVSGVQYWLEQAEQAWQRWKYHMRDVLDPRPGETFKRALGEQPSGNRGR